jgi:anthranilate synthase/aminodeoxychorismate synthase-like glutamine amidotransferase
VDVDVRRNDAISVDDVGTMAPEAIVISPGPCTPGEAGISVPLVRRWGATVPILGVCLGHQAIVEAYGGRVVRAGRVMHGKTSLVLHDGSDLFAAARAR